MARNEADREDLLKEAVALTERTELLLGNSAEPVTVGFRSGGQLSVYFGQDPVYQFDREGGLRRAYVGGFLFRSEHETLACLKRERTPESTTLIRTDLTESDLVEFQRQMISELRRLWEAIETGSTMIRGSVPEGADLRPQILSSLQVAMTARPWISASIRHRG